MVSGRLLDPKTKRPVSSPTALSGKSKVPKGSHWSGSSLVPTPVPVLLDHPVKTARVSKALSGQLVAKDPTFKLLVLKKKMREKTATVSCARSHRSDLLDLSDSLMSSAILTLKSKPFPHSASQHTVTELKLFPELLMPKPIILVLLFIPNSVSLLILKRAITEVADVPR